MAIAIGSMRFLAWNIRFGGIGPGRFDYDLVESPKNVKAVAKAILSQEADVVVLTEYRDAPETGGVIKAMLESRGYQSYVSNPGLDKNGTLMAFSEHVREHYDIHVVDNFKIDKEQLDEIYYYRWLNPKLVSVNGAEDLEVLGIHVPDVKTQDGDGRINKTLGYKKLFWEALIRFAQEKMVREENVIIMGDFNTGLNTVDKEPGAGDFYLSKCMEAFLELQDAKGRKWVDAWRKFHRRQSQTDYTWYMPGGKGFRLDYAFLTPALADKLKAVRYSSLERESGLSDHSMLIVEIAL
jgi:exodeoxyribonuclease III